MMEPQVRYCTTKDGVRIAYCAEGKGPPLVMTPVFLESFSFHHLLPEFDHFLKRLRPVRRVALYDPRGTGLSQRDAHGGLDAAMLDMEAVVETCGEPAAVWANLTYSIPAVRLAIARPDMVERLVLFASMARRADAFPDDVLRSFIELARSNWPLAAQTFGDSSTRQADPEAGLRWGEMYRESTSAEAVAQLLIAAVEHDDDIRDDLAGVTAPTLVLHRRGDLNVPLELGQQVAAGIPDASFVPLDGVITAYPMGDQEQVLRAALPFLGGAETTPVAELEREVSGTAVMLFADIADSTALTEQLGDAAFRTKATALDGLLRKLIREANGTPVEGKVLGDGVMAVFTSARQAIDCALRCKKAGDEGGLLLHLGIHAGDVIREGNTVYGGAVNIAQRVVDACPAGEVYVSDTVRSLARTSTTVGFEDRGEHELKGIPEPQRLFAVRESN
jgi:class 3 adenylate cyclase